MGKIIDIGGRIHNPEVGNVVTGANEIYDDTKGKKQDVINGEVDIALEALDANKQDNLTFDQTPTESSTNPVTSGGVYAADLVLQQAIEAILALIPSAASALNQLADKSFVNSSIATASATFRGTYNLVSDLHLSVTASHQDIATALASAVSTADNNDYCFVQIPTSDTSSDIRVTERYKFNGTAWAYEYDLNNSGFTAQQWEAINSGITALLVQKLGALPTAAELATLLLGKQNVLTFDNVPTSGSENPVKSGGLYQLFAAIDAKMPSDASANNKLVAENRLAAYVTAIIEALDASFDVTSTDGHVIFRITQTNGQIASVQILTSDIASASALTTLTGRVSTNEDDIAYLQEIYNNLSGQSDFILVDGALPSSGQQQGKIYRQPDQVNDPPQYYSDYMWNGASWVLMCIYGGTIVYVDGNTIDDLSIDDENGNSIALFGDGHIRTKNFDSSKSLKNEDSGNDLEISDETDYAVLAVIDGYPRTKNFNGKSIKDKVLDVEERTRVVEDTGLYETVVVNIADYDNNLVNVFNSIQPTKQKHYTIQIPEGTYNVDEWFTESYKEASEVAQGAYGTRGVELLDYTKLLGLGAPDKVILQWMNPDSATHWGYISTLNTNHWNELENLTVKANNIRYAVHDDLWDGKDRYLRIKDCTFEVSGNTTRAWGAGCNGNYDAVFENCKFIMDYYQPYSQSSSNAIQPFILHDNYYNVGKINHLVLRNCRFVNPYTEHIFYNSDTWEQVTYDSSYPEYDNMKDDYALNDCVNMPNDTTHSYKSLVQSNQTPPYRRGMNCIGLAFTAEENSSVCLVTMEGCSCNTYLETWQKTRLTGFGNKVGSGPFVNVNGVSKKVVFDLI